MQPRGLKESKLNYIELCTMRKVYKPLVCVILANPCHLVLIGILI